MTEIGHNDWNFFELVRLKGGGDYFKCFHYIQIAYFGPSMGRERGRGLLHSTATATVGHLISADDAR